MKRLRGGCRRIFCSDWARPYWAGVGTVILIATTVALVWPYRRPVSKIGQPLCVYFPAGSGVVKLMANGEVTVMVRVRKKYAPQAIELSKMREEERWLWMEDRE